MRWLEVFARGAAALFALAGGLAVALAHAAPAAPASDALLRHRAEITLVQAGAFVKLPLPPGVYARSEQPGLQDLRVVDARGERVPFALLAPRPDEQLTREQERAATLYPLPPRPAAGSTWPSPVDVTVEGDRISVKRRAPLGASPPARAPGWLLDLGERPRDEPRPHAVRLLWSGPGEFSAGYSLESSDELRRWRSAGGGQVLALAGSAGALTQPLVVLPEDSGRFVRLVWSDPTAVPVLTGAVVLTRWPRSVTLDAPTELTATASAEPPGAPVSPANTADARRALHFDLGAPLPLVELDLELTAGTQVVPLRVQVRTRADEPWQTATGAVFYRFDSGGQARRSPPLTLVRTARYLRLVPDERAAALDPVQTRLRVRAQLVSLVFAAQGSSPYALLAGSRQASVGALPLATLVPALDDERARFGRATLGAWTEIEPAVRQAEAAERRAAWRPRLLWAVLLAGVAGLTFMVWRLARSRT
jgi:hypothetical protein